MAKRFGIFPIGLIIIGARVVLMVVPGSQGNTGDGGLMLVGAVLGVSGFRMMTTASEVVGTSSTRSDSGRSRSSQGSLFVNRRVIAPQDSTPKLSF